MWILSFLYLICCWKPRNIAVNALGVLMPRFVYFKANERILKNKVKFVAHKRFIHFIQSVVADSQTDQNILKEILKINSITKFLLSRMKYVTEGGRFLMINTYNYFIIPMCKWSYSFIYYLILSIISFYKLYYCFQFLLKY